VNSDDAWTSDEFESRIIAATIALYETRTDVECEVRGISNFNSSSFSRMKTHGVYIPAKGRVCIDPEFGLSVLKWPQSGCMSFGSTYNTANDGNAEDDLLESYCRLVYFRRLNKLPSHSKMLALGDPYELIMAWPQDRGPVIGITSYLTINRKTGSISQTFPAWYANNHGKISEFASDPDFDKERLALGAAIQFIDDRRHIWTITAQNDVSKVTVGADAESVKSLLYARSLPMTNTGRKRPILHIVHAHKRRVASGTEIQIDDFLRGSPEVVMDGTKYTVSAPEIFCDELKKKK